MGIKAIYFDLFETLISEYENGQRKAPRSTHIVERYGIEANRFDNEWRLRQEKRMNGTYPDFPSVLREIFGTMGHDMNDEIIEALHQERIAAKFKAFDNMDQAILSTLDQIKQMGIKIGLISNCTPEEVTAWEASPLSTYFDDAIFSYQVKLAKPNPMIYQLACERIGVSPAESLFIGDGGSNELNGAAKAGMMAYQATWFVPANISERIKDFRKLAKPLELLNILSG
ncbi:HAD-IA family hydrolase [Paenibacillus sp. 5J-6]|uniref:HAD-IA family hydrolase n=1 Tax=Paenibacillus silvestris TaxID=2606219 RepID=A0A6L8V7L0_9BACL|nr:HAD-IA family hydrolase [Paenibacillus silvestris]MZQ86343.1 HAD-IA family hydrolase [Paenibacillus silvestris]